MRGNIIIVLLAATPALAGPAGCSKLSIDVDVVDDMRSISYQLNPEGRLTVSHGSGHFASDEAGQVYQTHLDIAAMERLRKVIYKSGYLFESPPLRTSLTGVFMVVEIHLGMWENKMQIRGTKVPSVSSIVDEVNTHLPDEYKIPYRPATKREEDYEKYLR